MWSMIQITAYLRDREALRIWKALPNKTEFLDTALKGTRRVKKEKISIVVERVEKPNVAKY